MTFLVTVLLLDVFYPSASQAQSTANSLMNIVMQFRKVGYDFLLPCYLRNEFNFWNVHGIMNASGILLSEALWAGTLRLHVNFARDLKYS